jgi:hypothetical protein
MKPPTDLGLNRTGMDMSPLQKDAMLDNTNAGPALRGGLELVMERRQSYILGAEPVGNVPFPGTFKGLAKTAFQKVSGNRPEIFLDKLGERLAFERTGVRLYEHLINKCLCRESELPEGLLENLIQNRNDEETHFHLVDNALRRLGADPTTVTPSADIAATASSGLIQILADPRTTVDEGLHALLVAELTDAEGWELLIELTDQLSLPDLKREFEDALLAEEEHLIQIRQAYSTMVVGLEKAAA